MDYVFKSQPYLKRGLLFVYQLLHGPVIMELQHRPVQQIVAPRGWRRLQQPRVELIAQPNVLRRTTSSWRDFKHRRGLGFGDVCNTAKSRRLPITGHGRWVALTVVRGVSVEASRVGAHVAGTGPRAPDAVGHHHEDVAASGAYAAASAGKHVVSSSSLEEDWCLRLPTAGTQVANVLLRLK